MTDIPVSGGSITADRTSDIRRSGNVTLAADGLDVNDFLPVGTEIRIRSGFALYSGRTEMVPLGVFRTEDVSYNEGASNTIGISFYDRAKAHQDVIVMIALNLAGIQVDEVINFYNDYTFGHTGLVPSIIIDDSFNQNQYMPGGTRGTGNHLEIVSRIAELFGGEQYFDINGDHVFGRIPSVTPDLTAADTVWDIDVGETGVLIEAARKVTRANTVNAVGVYGSIIDPLLGDRVYSEVFDNYALSPTFYNGKFGRKTKTISNDLLTTSDQCSVVAYEQLKNHQGLAKSIQFKSLWNPALDVGDLVLFTFLDGSQEIHLIDSLSLDLASGEMSGQTRSVQYIF
jgi:hypothetical protein